MLTLTHILLHNWHRFTHHVIAVQDGLYLAGHNGSGKSSILDAIQTVLIAHQSRIRFNSSAQERSQRDLDSYVRGKIGEGRWLRPGNTVAYVALEFTNTDTNEKFTIGTCIEAREGRPPDRSFFIIDDALSTVIDLAIPDGRPLPRRELKQALRNRRKARLFEQVDEYQTELLNSLGGLHERFFDLFIRALTFQPIRDIREFVERWLLEEKALRVETLQQVVQRLEELRVTATVVKEKIIRLEAIERHRQEARRWQAHYATYTLLAALLRAEAAQRHVAALQQQITDTQQQLATCQEELTTVQAALKGANEALLEVQVQLRQSSVMQRRADLERQIDTARREADAIRARWQQLLAALQQAIRDLTPVLTLDADQSILDAEEEPALRTLQITLAGLNVDIPPSPMLTTELQAAIRALDSATTRNQQAFFELDSKLKELHRRQTELEQRLAQLRRGLKPFPAHVERLRDLLASRIGGERPPLLCDLIDVPDEHWQNAVEAMLGPRRFYLIVPPRDFVAAMRELDHARAAEGLYDVGLIDLERSSREGRQAQPGSLAEQVQPRAEVNKVLRSYLNTVLGNIICCASVEELRQHHRAITADVVLYSEWAVRALRPDTYTPRYIGRRARQSQIQMVQDELQQITDMIAADTPRARDQQSLVKLLQDAARKFSNLHQRLDADLDEHPLRQQIAAWQGELAALDLSGLAELEREAQRLQAIVEQEMQHERQLTRRIGQLENAQETLSAQQIQAERQRIEREQQAQAERERLATAVAEAESLVPKHLDTPDLSAAIHNAESTAQKFHTRMQRELDQMRDAATAYNFSYQFTALPQSLDETRYQAEYERLQATELPHYEEKIAQAQREAEEELREHVLHRLREQMLLARQELERINDALSRLHFRHERYRFKAQPADDMREYYDLINDAQLIGTSGSLFQSDFYATHEAIFDQFYALLTRTPRTDAEREQQRRMTDYRSYLSYDIEVTHADGNTSRLSRIMGQTSGGETQTPFYVTIAASFAQLYHINERHHRPTIRLVAFDEAFSKMDQDRIGATLELLQGFGLQIITATPLERCEYLVPKICTSLVLSTVGDTVLIEPYRNYAALLAKLAAATSGNGTVAPNDLPDSTP